MTIRNIISLVESVAPSVQDIEETIVHEADEAAVSDARSGPANITFFDPTGAVRPYAGDREDMAMEGWAMVTVVDSYRVEVKYDQRMVTRQALEAAINAISATQADTIHIEDRSTRIPARYSIWHREKGLAALKTLLREIKFIRDRDKTPAMAESLDLGDSYFMELSEMSNVDLDEAMEDWRARFRQAYDREQKNKAGFERACDAARLTAAERKQAEEDVLALAESEEIEEARHGVVPASMLSGMKRWDAEHVLDVKDEVESRGGDLSSPEDTKAASADLAFADRALPPIAPRKNAIRAIKENGMFVIEDEQDDEPEEVNEAWFDTLAKNGKKDDTPASDEKEEETVEEGLVGDVMTRVIANGMSDAEIVKTLERAQVSRQAAKMSHVRPQHSKVEGWGDADFYTKEEHTLVMKVFKNFLKLHTSYGRKNQAVAEDFEKYARLAGYHGPRPKLAPDGINSHLRESTLDAEWSNTDERRFQNADYTVVPESGQWAVLCKGEKGPDLYPSQEAAHDACRNHWKWGDWPLA